MKNIKKILILFVVSLMMITNVKAAETLQGKIDNNEQNIILDKNYEETIKINENQNVMIDLNGYTLTSPQIEDLGTLTIKSSKEGGKIILTDSIYVGDYVKDENNKITRTIKAKFILESGKIETGDYGVYCMSGSTAIINGGEIVSKLAPLTGNNTTGAMNFEITGGTLTAKYGPAIYMPGPISLKISGGTFNGGVSLRMGKVNISGGTFNAISSDIDDVKEYYDYSGNAWLQDALYVFGGTYTTDIEGETNILDLNITGGTFINTNNQGSAIAIYDLGKVAQEIKVNISDNTKLITNATSRNAFDVLTLTDEGVTNIKKGYNNPEYIGKVKTTITGGTYSSSVAKYLDEDYIETLVNNTYVVGSKKLSVEAPTIDETKKVTEVIIGVKSADDYIEDLAKAIKDGKIEIDGISPMVIVTINKMEKNQLPIDISESISKIAQDKKLNLTNYFDITLNVENSATNEIVGTLSSLSKEMVFNIAIPDELLNTNKDYKRVYYIIRYHDNKAEIIETILNGNVLAFASDRFSTYALAYEDKKIVTEENPKTADDVVIDIIVGGISVLGLCLSIKSLKKRHDLLS